MLQQRRGILTGLAGVCRRSAWQRCTCKRDSQSARNEAQACVGAGNPQPPSSKSRCAECVQAIRLATVHVRRGYADSQDPALNSHSKLNCITACVAANEAGADEGLMLDPHGCVATCNSVNFFIVVECAPPPCVRPACCCVRPGCVCSSQVLEHSWQCVCGLEQPWQWVCGLCSRLPLAPVAAAAFID